MNYLKEFHSENGRINLFNMDCMEYMAQFPDNYFELAIVDPPYGIKRDGGFSGFSGFGGFGEPIERKKYKGNWDKSTPEIEYFNELIRVSKNQIVWGGNFLTDKLPQANHWLFWDKLNTMPSFSDGELAWTSFKRNSVKRHTLQYNGLLGKELERIHPTQKPVKLYEWLLKNYAKDGDKILDTHLGSASSAIAAHRMGFEFFGTELDGDYFMASVERFEREAAQLDMFSV